MKLLQPVEIIDIQLLSSPDQWPPVIQLDLDEPPPGEPLRHLGP